MPENRPSKAIHFGITSLAGPTAEEKLAETARHAEFWLMQVTSRAAYAVRMYGDGSFGSICHKLYVGGSMFWVKVPDDAG